MLSLQGKRTLVAGGAGDVGEGVVRAFLDQGTTAIVPSRSEEKLDALRTRLNPSEPDRLITVGADVGAEDGARELRFSIRRDFGGLDDAVASLGGWWQGHPLTRISLVKT